MRAGTRDGTEGEDYITPIRWVSAESDWGHQRRRV